MSNKLTDLVDDIVAKVKPEVTPVTTDKNNILTVTRRPKKAAAVQFTGRNGAEVIAFVKEYAGVDYGHLRNGGSYVTISYPNQGGRARKGDWVVVDSDGTVLVLDAENFDILFSIKG